MAAATPLVLAECPDGAPLPPGPAALLASFPALGAIYDDALFALVVVLIAETGFELETFLPNRGAPLRFDEGYNKRRLETLRQLPPGWRQPPTPGTGESPQRSVVMVLPGFREHRVRIVAVTVGGALVVNVLLNPGIVVGPRSLCLSLRAVRFLEIRGGQWRTRRLQELSRRVKDCLGMPARCAILRAEGLMRPSFDGMPGELMLRVARLLTAQALLALGCTSKKMLELSHDPALWRGLLRRDFGVTLAEEDSGANAEALDPLTAYRRRYERERIWWRDREARQRWQRNMRHSDALREWPSNDSNTSLPPPTHRVPPVWYLRAEGTGRRPPGFNLFNPPAPFPAPVVGPAPTASTVLVHPWRMRHHHRLPRRCRHLRGHLRSVPAFDHEMDHDYNNNEGANADLEPDNQFVDAPNDNSQ